MKLNMREFSGLSERWMQVQRQWQPVRLVCGHSVFDSLWRWPRVGWSMPRHWAAEGPWQKHSLQAPVLQHCKSLLAQHLPFQPTVSPAELTRSPGGNGASGVKSDFDVEMSRKPGLSPLAALCRAIIHAGDPMLGDMGSERGNV